MVPVGDGLQLLIGVGKSCLLLRFCEDSWTPSFITTIGMFFSLLRSYILLVKSVWGRVMNRAYLGDQVLTLRSEQLSSMGSESSCRL